MGLCRSCRRSFASYEPGLLSDSTKQSTAKTRSDSTGRDPFKKYEPQKAVSKRAGEIRIPTIEERINMYKAQKQAAMNARVYSAEADDRLLAE